MPAKALEVYAADKSGPRLQMYPGTNVPFHDRVDYQTHVSIAKFLGGKGLSGLYRRFMTNVQTNLKVHPQIKHDWVTMPDLMIFFQRCFGSALTQAICGPILQNINPDFMDDLLEYDQNLPDLVKGLPSWMAPKAYNVRDKLLQSIHQWHAVARSLFINSSIDPDGDYDPFWGCGFMRNRQKTFAAMSNFDYDAFAASDLGFIWV
ncbi:MAG: hypothetical protein Q9166_006300 [cf. Caloplaca sp. 2 TL-2023]